MTLDPSSDLPRAQHAGPVSLAVFRLARAHKAFAADLLRMVGLHPGQELLLMYLWENGPQRQTDLARLVDTDSASMTRTVQRLERSGFVRRIPCPGDRRVTLVEPTPASLALRPRVEELWARLEDATAGGLGLAERRSTVELLARLERNVAEAACAWGDAVHPGDTPASGTPGGHRPASGGGVS